MVPVTIRTKSDKDGTIHEGRTLYVVKLLKSFRGKVGGFIYRWEDNTLHMCGGITENTILMMDNREYDMGNDFEHKKFMEDFFVLNSLDHL